MKLFGEVDFSVPVEAQEEFFNAIEEKLTNGWHRDKEKEKEANHYRSKWYVFICDEIPNRPSAALFVAKREDGSFWISNIVPKSQGQLSKDEYNNILHEFCNSFIVPVAGSFGTPVKETPGLRTIDDLISADTANKLKQFSSCANKSTGSSHPCDKERWYEFIISCVKNRDDLTTDILEIWLEEEGWTPEITANLAIEFEQETGLLRHYLRLV